MRIQNYRKSLLIVLVITTMLTAVHATAITQNEGYPNPGDLSPDQGPGDIVLPSIGVKSINVTTEEPEEDKTISVNLSIQNNASNSFDQLLLAAITVSSTDFQGGPPGSRDDSAAVEMNKSFSIEAGSTTTIPFEFTVDSGNYQIVGNIIFNGTIIPGSTQSTSLLVIGPPIGNINTLILAVGGVVVAVFGIMMVPAIIDQIRKLMHMNNQKKTE